MSFFRTCRSYGEIIVLAFERSAKWRQEFTVSGDSAAYRTREVLRRRCGISSSQGRRRLFSRGLKPPARASRSLAGIHQSRVFVNLFAANTTAVYYTYNIVVYVGIDRVDSTDARHDSVMRYTFFLYDD